MKLKPKDMIFISRIKRDGSGVEIVTDSHVKHLRENKIAKDQKYKVRRLSRTENTYIAMGFNSYVVQLK